MSGKTACRTRQMEDLLDYLKVNPGKHVTIAEVLRHFRDCGLRDAEFAG